MENKDKASSGVDRAYEDSVRRIIEASARLPFDEAAASVEVSEESLRPSIADDALKVLIAERHFAGGAPLKELSKSLGLPVARLETARRQMMKDVEAAAIEAYKLEMGKGHSGNA